MSELPVSLHGKVRRGKSSWCAGARSHPEHVCDDARARFKIARQRRARYITALRNEWCFVVLPRLLPSPWPLQSCQKRRRKVPWTPMTPHLSLKAITDSHQICRLRAVKHFTPCSPAPLIQKKCPIDERGLWDFRCLSAPKLVTEASETSAVCTSTLTCWNKTVKRSDRGRR